MDYIKPFLYRIAIWLLSIVEPTEISASERARLEQEAYNQAIKQCLKTIADQNSSLEQTTEDKLLGIQYAIEGLKREPVPVALSACPTCNAPWVEHHCPYTPQVKSDRVCEVCSTHLNVDTIRTHDGHWRCKEHKGS